MRHVTALFCLSIMAVGSLAQEAIKPAAGNGSSASPYQVSTLSHLYWIAASEEEVPAYTQEHRWGSYYIQTADIDASATMNWFDDQGWLPIGYYHGFYDNLPFSGRYNGQGHLISGLYINRPQTNRVGLFGFLSGGRIYNLGMTMLSITGNNYVGGMVGYINHYAIVENCNASGSVSGKEVVGGLLGLIYQNNNVNNCFSTGVVSGYSSVGGLVGHCIRSFIRDSFTHSEIHSNGHFSGGLTGYASSSSSIHNSYSGGQVNGRWSAGGLAGFVRESVIDQCHSTSDVVALQKLGGLIGEHVQRSVTTNSYASGSISGYEVAGGLVGLNSNSEISHCYARVHVSGQYELGGFAARIETGNSFGDNNNYWDMEASGMLTSVMGQGRNQSQMKHPHGGSTYSQWDFSATWQADANHTHNHGYPYLQAHADAWQAPLAGDGTEENPWQIATLQHLCWIAADVSRWSKHYIQTAHIDAAPTSSWFEGKGWPGIGTAATLFSGSYYGNGFQIDALHINRPEEHTIGLFGLLGGAVVEQLGLTNVQITGAYWVGSLATGATHGSHISQCYSTGSVTSTDHEADVTGGLIGFNHESVITDSYSHAAVSGASHVGGLLGRNNQGIVQNCYAAGQVSGEGITGGLVGSKVAKDSHDDSGNYWNIQTTQQTESAMGAGRTTNQMAFPHDADTFSGWEFPATWSAWPGISDGLPYLSWQADMLPAPANGSGTAAAPWQVATLRDLYWITEHPDRWDKHFVQTAHIDAAPTVSWFGGQGWPPIGDNRSASKASRFSGTYNGQGHRIDGLTIDRPDSDYVGLFGHTHQGTITRLGVTNANIRGKRSVGGLAGRTDHLSIITHCHSSGSIHATGNLSGGITGVIYGSTVAYCHSTANVTGQNTVGGLFGYSRGGVVSNCYSRGSVSGQESVGGLLGNNFRGSVSHSYATGMVSGDSDTGGLAGQRTAGTGYADNNNYWDIQTTGKDNSAMGNGRSTTDMTFPHSSDTYEGWDFHDTWMADAIHQENDGYPALHDPRMTLTIAIQPGVAGQAGGAGDYRPGVLVSLSATAGADWVFEKWTDEEGMALGSTPVFDYVMPAGSTTLTAHFSPSDEKVVADLDGNLYPTVVIGIQEWLAGNLRTSRYQDGSPIATGLDGEEWVNTKEGAFAIYTHEALDGLNDDKEVLQAYGGLYNFFAATDPRGICPAGWRVPSHHDWTRLERTVCLTMGYPNCYLHFPFDEITMSWRGTQEGTVLKSCRQVGALPGGECDTHEHPRWDAHDNYGHGSDLFRFSGLPGGHKERVFDRILENGWWWTTTKMPTTAFVDQPSDWAMSRRLNYGTPAIRRQTGVAMLGYSIRCIKGPLDTLLVETDIVVTETPGKSTVIIKGRGVVVHNGASDVTACGMVYSSMPHPTLSDQSVAATTIARHFEVTLTDLQPATRYYARAYATNAEGTTYGDQQSFYSTPMNVTFHVDLSEATLSGALQHFDPSQHRVYMTGAHTFWAVPGSKPDEQEMEKLSDDPLVYGKTLRLVPGTFDYKYFTDALGQGWAGAEWSGHPNRQVGVEGDARVYDIWAVVSGQIVYENRYLSDLELGPDSGETCYDAIKTITTGSANDPFVALPGSTLSLIAGERILMRAQTHLHAGSQVHAWIAPGGPFCGEPGKQMMAAKVEAERSEVPSDSEGSPDKVEAEVEVERDKLFRVYPNPTPGRFTLELLHADEDGSMLVEVYGILGERVLRKKLPADQHQHELSLEGQVAGIYIVRVVSRLEAAVGRIMKR